MTAYFAGQIVLVDWRGDAIAKEPNKLRPCVIVEDERLFDPAFPNVLVVPLTERSDFIIPSLAVVIEPNAENGCADTCYAVSHSITVASKKRIAKSTPSRITPDQLTRIRAQIAECIGLVEP